MRVWEQSKRRSSAMKSRKKSASSGPAARADLLALRQRLDAERKSLTLLTSPLATLSLFFQWLFRKCYILIYFWIFDF